MWGNVEDVPTHVMRTHVLLADRLSPHAWNRSQIWKETTSVHSWKFGGRVFAFDVVPTATRTTVTLISRDKSIVDDLKVALQREGVHFKQVGGRPERMLIKSFRHDGESPPIEQIASLIESVRKAVALSLTNVETWLDPDSDLSLRFSVKRERKECPSIVFMFSSIRTKPHWLDFEGPHGKSLSANRARIVFMQDDFADAFCYHMAIGGDATVWAATSRFIVDYVATHGYAWDNVILCGMSKGATSAILVGSQLPNCTVLALAPQLRVGDYLMHSKRLGIISTISGKAGDEGAKVIDQIMWSGLRHVRGRWGIGNCYVLTSNNDLHCTGGLQEFERLFETYEYGQLCVSTDASVHTTSHLKTVHYLAPQFISMLGLLTSGLRPVLL